MDQRRQITNGNALKRRLPLAVVIPLVASCLLAGCSLQTTKAPAPAAPQPANTSTSPAPPPGATSPTPPHEPASPEPTSISVDDVNLDWQLISPQPQSRRLSAVAASAGTTVAVGQSGTIQYSRDGQKTWAAQRVGDASLLGVAFGNGRFVAVGEKGTILTSDDGQAWIQRAAGSTDDLWQIAYGAGTFVVAGGRSLLTSTDGITWTSSTTPMPKGLGLITYGNGQFWVAGDSDVIASSKNGIAWTQHQVPLKGSGPKHISQLVAGNGVVIAKSNEAFYAANDAEHWTTTDGAWRMSAIVFAGDHFIAYGSSDHAPTNYFWTTKDGVTWSKESGLAEAGSPTGIIFTGASWLGVGDYGAVYGSPDGVRWNLVTPNPGETPRGILQGPGNLISVSENGHLLVSVDGLHWIDRSAIPIPYTGRVSYGAGRYWAFGSEGECDCPVAAVSVDGSTWTKKNDPPHGSLGAPIFGRGVLVAPAGDGIWTSPNGEEWTRHAVNTTERMRVVMMAGDLFIASDIRGSLFTSQDGITWDKRHQGDPQAFYSFDAVAFGNGRYVTTNSVEALVSADGVRWVSHRLTPRFSASAIAFGNGLFVAVGDAIAISRDGQHWRVVSSPVDYYLYDVAYLNGRFVATGPGGTILTARF